MIAYIITLIILLVTIRGKIINKVKDNTKENEEYNSMHMNVACKASGSLGRIGLLSRRIVYSELKQSSKPELQDEDPNPKSEEEEIYEIFKDMYNKVNPGTNIQRIYFYHALRFILKTELMSDPYDLRGSRRCKRVESILNKLQLGHSVAQHGVKNSLDFLKLPIFVYTKVFTYFLLVILGLWLYDLYTDISVIAHFVNLMCHLDVDNRFCPPPLRDWITNSSELILDKFGDIGENHTKEFTISYGDVRNFVTILGLHNINNITYIAISMIIFAFSKPIQKWATVVKVKLQMALPIHERKSKRVDTQSVLDRYQLSINEAGFESFICMGLSIGNYLNIRYMLVQLSDIHDSEFEKQITLFINEKTIALSVASSVLAMTVAEIKSHETQHEYALSCRQKIIYAMASLVNTLTISLLYASLMSACMFWCCRTFFTAEIGSHLHNFGYFMTGIICPCTLYLFNVVAVYLSNYIYKDLKNSHRNVNSGGSWTDLVNPVTVIQLPNAHTHEESYNSMQSTNLLIMISRQFIGTILLAAWLTGLTTFNVAVHEFDINKKVEWQVLYIVSIFCIPLGHLLQYVMLWFFFQCDEGFFTQSTAYFEYKPLEKQQSKVKNVLCEDEHNIYCNMACSWPIEKSSSKSEQFSFNPGEWREAPLPLTKKGDSPCSDEESLKGSQEKLNEDVETLLHTMTIIDKDLNQMELDTIRN